MRRKEKDVATSVATPAATKQPSPSVSHAFSAPSIPFCSWRAHWLTTTEFAEMMGRSPWTVQSWIRNGTLAEFGIPVCQFRYGRPHSGRTFIKNVY
jgi:hypothetical protein